MSKYIFVFIFVIISLVMIIPRLIRINDIDCKSQKNGCTEEIQRNLSDLEGQKYIVVIKSIDKVLTASNTIDKYYFQYKFPDRITIDIILKEVKYALKPDNSNWNILVSLDGKVIKLTEEGSVKPVLISSKSLNVGDTLDKPTLNYLKIAHLVGLSSKFDKAQIKSDGLYITLENGIIVVFPEGDPEILVGSFNLIDSRLNKLMEEFKMTEVKIIDLRFKNPIIK